MYKDNNFSLIPLDELTPDPNQPRRFIQDVELLDLKASIEAVGVITPITVRDDDGQLIIVAGERRWRASKMAGRTTIPAVFVDEMDSHDIEFLQIAENLDRDEINPLDLSFKLNQLIDHHGRDAVCEKLGKTPSWLSKKTSFAKLTDRVKELVANGLVRDYGIANSLDKLAKSQKTNDTEKFEAALKLIHEKRFNAKEFFKRGYDWRCDKDNHNIDDQEREEGLARHQEEDGEPIVIKTKKVYWRGALDVDEITRIIRKTEFVNELEEDIESISDPEKLKAIFSQFREWLAQ